MASLIISEFGTESFGVTVFPARQRLAACGYDENCYISTAKLKNSPYTTQALIEAKLGGATKLIAACDDGVPSSGILDTTVFNAILQTVTSEINGYISTIYPIPLVQSGTIAVLNVAEVNSAGGVTGLDILTVGNYLTAPAEANTPAYLKYLDPYITPANKTEQLGSGLVLNVEYENQAFSDEDGSEITTQSVSAVTITTAGTNYTVGELIVLTGGTSVVPALIRQAMLDLVCHTLYKRRLAPDEKNPFSGLAKQWRDHLISIGEGEKQLDGTFRRFFSPGAAWTTDSVMGGANSL